MTRHWNTYSGYLKEKYGAPVYRVSVDAGLSCPNRRSDGTGGCIYCDGTGASAVHLRVEEKDKASSSALLLGRCEDIRTQIDSGLRYIRWRYKSRLAMLYFQSWSNTYAPVPVLRKLYDEALAQYPFVSLIVSTRPDLLCDDVVALLASYRTEERDVWVELGLQSASDSTLEALKRGHDVNCFIDAHARLKAAGIKVCTHVMMLPFIERREDMIDTIRLVNDSGSDAVKIHNLCLTRGTRLLEDYACYGCYAGWSVRRHVETTALLLAYLDRNIIVERLLTEMTKARLVYPSHYLDKRDILEMIDSYMESRSWTQGCLI